MAGNCPRLSGPDVDQCHLLSRAAVRLRGRFSPGLFTAIVLFYPVGIACYLHAAANGMLSLAALITSFVLGALLMASPVILLLIKDKPYFRQDR